MDKDDPKVIFLAPRCCDDDGRTWCVDDNNWECECDGEPHKPVKYYRADLVEKIDFVGTVERLVKPHGL